MSQPTVRLQVRTAVKIHTLDQLPGKVKEALYKVVRTGSNKFQAPDEVMVIETKNDERSKGRKINAG